MIPSHRSFARHLPQRAVLGAILAISAAPPAAVAAPQGGSFAELEQSFERRRAKLRSERAGFEAQRKLMRDVRGELKAFLGTSKGVDRVKARLMLTDLELGLGQPAAAKETLLGLDTKAAPPLALAAAAQIAAALELNDRKDAWLDLAIRKPESFEHRMALCTHLLALFQDEDRAKQIYQGYADAAQTDEDKAKLEWYWAAANREREDLPEGSYEQALKKISERFPGTYWGRLTADRVRAMHFKVGEDAIALELTDLDGKTVRTADMAGNVILLSFQAAFSGPSKTIAPVLVDAAAKYGEKGLRLVSISLDESPKVARQAAKALGYTWPQCCDGRSWQSPPALRYYVEDVPHLVLIDRTGKIAGLNFYPVDERGIAELHTAIRAALDGKTEGAKKDGSAGR